MDEIEIKIFSSSFVVPLLTIQIHKLYFDYLNSCIKSLFIEKSENYIIYLWVDLFKSHHKLRAVSCITQRFFNANVIDVQERPNNIPNRIVSVFDKIVKKHGFVEQIMCKLRSFFGHILFHSTFH